MEYAAVAPPTDTTTSHSTMTGVTSENIKCFKNGHMVVLLIYLYQKHMFPPVINNVNRRSIYIQ